MNARLTLIERYNFNRANGNDARAEFIATTLRILHGYKVAR